MLAPNKQPRHIHKELLESWLKVVVVGVAIIGVRLSLSAVELEEVMGRCAQKMGQKIASFHTQKLQFCGGTLTKSDLEFF